MKIGGIMLNTLKNIVYEAFGLSVISEIPLPELPQRCGHIDFVDVEITIGKLTSDCERLVISDVDVFVNEKLVVFQIADTAIFSVQEGNKIIVTPMVGYSEDAVRLYLLGTCMGAILLQRKILPLHGSAIVIDGKAYGFVGDSGAGKSTLATAFINSGYQLITDDVIAVSFLEEDIPVVTPSYPQQKLWQESLNKFGMETHQYRPLLERETKFAVPVPSHFISDPIPLAGIFELVKTKNEQIEIYPVKGFKQLHTLFYHTYRNFMISPSGLMEWHFDTMTRTLNRIEIFQLSRPTSRFTAHELKALILKTIQKGE